MTAIRFAIAAVILLTTSDAIPWGGDWYVAEACGHNFAHATAMTFDGAPVQSLVCSESCCRGWLRR